MARVTGPAEVDGHKVAGFFRSHQVPLGKVHSDPAHLKELERWLRSYRPEELFDAAGRLIPELRVLAENSLDDGFDASPAIVGDQLLVRGRRYLYCLAEPRDEAAAPETSGAP